MNDPNYFQSNQNVFGAFNSNFSQHAKTFSLPVAFDHSMPQQQQQQQQMGPLPPGWSTEKAPNGQPYYINNITKTTSWDDPRFNNSMTFNQSEISSDLKAHIYKTIPMPSGWQEAVTETGQLYFINHNTHKTHWDDPRIEIYMQQHHKQSSYQQNPQYMANNSKFSNPFMPQQPINQFPNQMNGFNQFGAMHGAQYNLSNNFSMDSRTVKPMNPAIPHSTSTNSLSQSSSNSSLSSLSSSNQDVSNQLPFGGSSTNSVSSSGSSGSGDLYVNSLRKSLDKVLDKKQAICNQLKELCEKENVIKSKMRPQDIEDAMRMMKEGVIYQSKPIEATTQMQSQQAIKDALNISSSNASTSLNNTTDQSIDMDSTLVVADTSANNI